VKPRAARVAAVAGVDAEAVDVARATAGNGVPVDSRVLGVEPHDLLVQVRRVEVSRVTHASGGRDHLELDLEAGPAGQRRGVGEQEREVVRARVGVEVDLEQVRLSERAPRAFKRVVEVRGSGVRGDDSGEAVGLVDRVGPREGRGGDPGAGGTAGGGEPGRPDGAAGEADRAEGEPRGEALA
jgi:hypothetical protein